VKTGAIAADHDYDNDHELNYMPYMFYMVEKAAVTSAFSRLSLQFLA